jgi:hypothetical protein
MIPEFPGPMRSHFRRAYGRLAQNPEKLTDRRFPMFIRIGSPSLSEERDCRGVYLEIGMPPGIELAFGTNEELKFCKAVLEHRLLQD